MKRNRRRWPKHEKQRLADEARRRRNSGETFATICSDLDVLEGSLRLWMTQFPGSAFREVSIEAPPAPPLVESNNIRVTMPDGVRLDGLGIDDVILLLEVRG